MTDGPWDWRASKVRWPVYITAWFLIIVVLQVFGR